jgi:hypothetical protein
MTPQRLSFLKFPKPGERINDLDLETDVGVVDIRTSLLGPGDFAHLKRAADKFEIEGCVCWVISWEDLIVAREVVGRGRDQLTAVERRVIAAKRKRGAQTRRGLRGWLGLQQIDGVADAEGAGFGLVGKIQGEVDA